MFFIDMFYFFKVNKIYQLKLTDLKHYLLLILLKWIVNENIVLKLRIILLFYLVEMIIYNK
jgi:hypothetical protein